jgi:hypothetical protein
MNQYDALRDAVAGWLDHDHVNHEWTHKINPSGEVLHLHPCGSTVLVLTSTIEDNATEAISQTLQAEYPSLVQRQGAYILKSNLILERAADVRAV